ncbi:MAG TPA: hypothetical protein PJ988_14825, partial [Anaerolinea sp.]|nr:hypothetical protein [Anaerolinea sp.]
MDQIKLSRSLGVSFVIAISLMLASLWVFPSSVKAADPCTTPGVVCVTTSISSSTTWTSNNIYYLKNNITVAKGVTLTIQGGTIIKFDYPYSATSPNANPYALTILKEAGLIFQDTNTTNKRVLFTSGRDDSADAGGDTNGDANQTLPGYGDWKGLILEDWVSTTPIENLTFRYSREGLNLKANTLPIPNSVVVQNNGFYQALCGVTVTAPGNYHNLVTVQSNGFYGNQYGLCTSVGAGTGQALPTITGNHFESNLILPYLFTGASYPTYTNNTYIGTADPSDPNNPTDHLGIGVAGKWNSSGTWVADNNLPFVVVTPVEISTAASITVNEGSV